VRAAGKMAARKPEPDFDHFDDHLAGRKGRDDRRCRSPDVKREEKEIVIFRRRFRERERVTAAALIRPK